LIGNSVELITGEVDIKKRTELLDSMRYGDLRIIIATSLADEGLDIPRLDALITAGAGKSNTRILQRVGRVLRLFQGKQDPIIVDFYDNVKYMQGQTLKRIQIYKSESEFKLVKKY